MMRWWAQIVLRNRVLTPQLHQQTHSVVAFSHMCCLCVCVCSIRERSAEQAPEVGLRRNHSVSEGGHAGVGENARNSWEGKGQIWRWDHTYCSCTRYILGSTNTYSISVSPVNVYSSENQQRFANIDQTLTHKAPKTVTYFHNCFFKMWQKQGDWIPWGILLTVFAHSELGVYFLWHFYLWCVSLIIRSFCSVHFLVSACSAPWTGRLSTVHTASNNESNTRIYTQKGHHITNSSLRTWWIRDTSWIIHLRGSWE